MELEWNTYHATGKLETELAKKFVDAIRLENDIKFHKNKSAVYFMSSNAGTFSSIAFWKNALQHSPRFANPGVFPWTLANATSGYIARRFSITGPNYTIVDNEINEEQLIFNFKNDKEKFFLKNMLCIHWELETDNKEQLSVKVNWIVLQ